MLQGISKLDNLLKISCFQQYKIGTIEAQKNSLKTSLEKSEDLDLSTQSITSN